MSAEPSGGTKFRRSCAWCKSLLAGKKGHGFVINGGKTVICGQCAYKPRT